MLHNYFRTLHFWCMKWVKLLLYLRRCLQLDFILNEIKYFQFGYCSIFHNSFHEILRNETHCGCCFIAVIWRKMKSAERKHRKFHKNKDSRSKDQSKNEFHFIAHAVKTNVNNFFIAKQHFISDKFHFK